MTTATVLAGSCDDGMVVLSLLFAINASYVVLDVLGTRRDMSRQPETQAR